MVPNLRIRRFFEQVLAEGEVDACLLLGDTILNSFNETFKAAEISTKTEPGETPAISGVRTSC